MQLKVKASINLRAEKTAARIAKEKSMKFNIINIFQI